MYTIYINETSLIITESISKVTKSYQQIEPKKFSFSDFYAQVKSGALNGTYVINTSKPKKLFKSIRDSLKLIEAAGGLVSNEENRYLFIFRKGKWDLPKGKLDNGEKVREAARREVEEECGIKVNKVKDKICKTWHVYEMGGKIVLKKTTWYFMSAKNQAKLVPQLEEDITEARWIAPGDFGQVRQNTYPLIKDVISVVG